MSEVIPKL